MSLRGVTKIFKLNINYNNNNNNDNNNNLKGTTSRNYTKLPIRHRARTSESVKVQTFIIGQIITCAINCNHRIPATLYTFEAGFVSEV